MDGDAGAASREGRVKLHVFEPSGRRVWTVVGSADEHWVDPEAGYCSCPSYYYRGRGGSRGCYHVESARLAREAGSAAEVRFSDAEYAGFVAGLACGP